MISLFSPPSRRTRAPAGRPGAALVVLLAALVGLAAAPTHAQGGLPAPPPFTTTLVSSDGGSGAYGLSVALSDDGRTALVGAYQFGFPARFAGAAYVFVYEDGAWTEQARLQAGDASSGANFGFSVALSADGRTALVGAYSDDGAGRDAGAAYVFTSDGSAWTEQAKLVPDDVNGGDQLGFDVDLSNDGATAVVGARYQAATGSAYVYALDGATWTLQSRLTSAAPQPGDAFGEAVAVSGDGQTVAVGAPADDDQGTTSGAAFVFVRDGAAWTQQAQLLPSGGGEFSVYGRAVALDDDGDTALVGRPQEGTENGRGVGFGSGYVFVRDGIGSWTEQARLQGADAEIDDKTADAVALSGDGQRAVLGSRLDDTASGANAGSAYLFAGDGGSWTQYGQLTADDADGGDGFGIGVATTTDGGVVLVGAQGPRSAYVFGTPGATPPPPLDLLVEESITVTDDAALLLALQLLVQETVGVTDEVDLTGALQLLVQETVGVRDTPLLERPGAAVAVVFVSVDGRYDPGPPIGLDVVAQNVVGMGNLLVGLFETPPDPVARRAAALPYRWLLVVDEALTLGEGTAVRIALDELDQPPADPASTVVYYRPTPGEGPFTALPTAYDAEANELVATGVAGGGELEIREVATLACSTGAPLSFDADGDGVQQGEGGGAVEAEDFSVLDPERVTVRNGAAEGAVDLGGCSFIVFDPFSEAVTFAATTEALVPAGGVFSLATTGGDAPLPDDALPDGPGAFALVTGAADVGDDVLEFVDDEGSRVVAAVVYGEDRSVFGSVQGGATGAQMNAFLEALASAFGAVSTEWGGPVDLSVSVAPNPSAGRARVLFGVAEGGDVRVAVYDALGREVVVLADGPRSPGRHAVALEAGALPSGVYLVRVTGAVPAQTVRLTISR